MNEQTMAWFMDYVFRCTRAARCRADHGKLVRFGGSAAGANDGPWHQFVARGRQVPQDGPSGSAASPCRASECWSIGAG
jgi:hypothetical protein